MFGCNYDFENQTVKTTMAMQHPHLWTLLGSPPCSIASCAAVSWYVGKWGIPVYPPNRPWTDDLPWDFGLVFCLSGRLLVEDHPGSQLVRKWGYQSVRGLMGDLFSLTLTNHHPHSRDDPLLTMTTGVFPARHCSAEGLWFCTFWPQPQKMMWTIVFWSLGHNSWYDLPLSEFPKVIFRHPY
jgi:hypothetical protein